ncbi:MAG TPA: SIMPL domain-containing protein [Candidatus Pacearchaeota archaeon]|nr:SIMPL domain-containing protein [Candidatus Pacearchaeota archaeon]
MATIDTKRNPFMQILLILISAFTFVLIFYFLVMINAKIKETKYIGNIQRENIISVSKTGTVYVRPDLAVVTITATTNEKTVTAAINKNSEKSAAIKEFLKQQGVEDKDIKTVNYIVNPRYEYIKLLADELESSILYPNGKRTLVGYEASESLEVKIRQLDKIGDITTGAVKAGADDVGNLVFTVENIDIAKAQARAEAIAKAKSEAQIIANNLDIHLGKIVGFNESGNTPIYFNAAKAYDESSISFGSTPQASVSIGENKIEVTVNITYEIN